MARVLLVDDDAAALEIRKLILQRAGHFVLTASTASEARASPRTEIVMLDLRLPRVEDGLALIREFHAAGMRVIVLCGNRADLDGRPEAACVDTVIEKPARSEVLLEAVQARPKIA
ncbi:MAG TPA: response regulator [Bryobacteraceae bacterium]|jgi:DNA-binding response OmpR family regulator|nr:response regulator [Bryobacteraceae bacterium]